jgi:HAD superfamily hydrolase (TIGR01493 family)
VAGALGRIGRPAAEVDVERIVGDLEGAARRPEIERSQSVVDTSPALHRRSYQTWFAAAAIDDMLGEALYTAESDLSLNPFATDTGPTIAALKGAGLTVVVLSDIHVDIRPAFTAAGLAGHVDNFVLSFEHGVQKPDPRFFRIALAAAGAPADRVLMVGDRSSHDGAAVELGIKTLLLPQLRNPSDERLAFVTAACGIAPATISGGTKCRQA